LVIPSDVELVLIVAICGIIAISIYVLYLLDKLLSRVESLERSLVGLSWVNEKPKELEEAVRQTRVSLSQKIGAVNEILESTGNDIDSINSKLSSYVTDIEAMSERMQTGEQNIAESKIEIATIQRDVSLIARKLDQLEKEAELISARQQLVGEF